MEGPYVFPEGSLALRPVLSAPGAALQGQAGPQAHPLLLPWPHSGPLPTLTPPTQTLASAQGLQPLVRKRREEMR